MKNKNLKWLFLFLFLFIILVSLFIIWFSPGSSNIKSYNLETNRGIINQKKLPINASELHSWLDSGELFVKTDNDYVIYNIEENKIIKNLSEIYTTAELGVHNIGKNGWGNFYKISREEGLILREGPFYVENVSSVNNVTDFIDLDFDKDRAGLDVNDIDGSFYNSDKKDELMEDFLSKNSDWADYDPLSYKDLFSSKHGHLLLYNSTDNRKKFLLSLYDNGYNLKNSIEWDNPKYDATGNYMVSIYDPSVDKYLWYLKRKFGLDEDEGESRANWTFSAWIMNPDLTIDKKIDLPAGPWVRGYSFSEEMECFSCGCDCYEDVSIRYKNNNIYMSLSGKALKESHKGVYKLIIENENYKWNKIVDCDVNINYDFSSDGSQMVYVCEDSIYTVDVK